MRISLFFFVLLFFFIAASYSQSNELPEWLMEDAFDGEYVKPFDVDVVSPAEVKTAMELYKKGDYLEALGFLKKIRDLNLPDGRLDFFVFVIAECNRMLKLNKKAMEEYSYLASRFPSSDKVPPSLYRIIEFAVDEKDFEKADSVYQVFSMRFPKHPLASSVKYAAGRGFYIQKKYNDALDVLKLIPGSSSRFYQAQFLSALCLIAAKQYQKAFAYLDNVISSGKNIEMISEAQIVAGDSYCLLKKIPEALKYYSQVSPKAKRYKYSIVKTAKAHIDTGQYKQAKKIATQFLNKEQNGEYFFEMATILEMAYTAEKNEKEAKKVRDLIHSQLIDSRVVFEVYEEIDKLTDMNRNWQIIEYEAIRNKNDILVANAQKNQKKIKELKRKNQILLKQINPNSEAGNYVEIPHLAERRYLTAIKKNMQIYEDSITSIKNEMELNASLIKSDANSEKISVMDSLEDVYRRFKLEFEENEREYVLVEKECFGNETKSGSQEEEMQARFVDWAFIKYQDKNSQIISIAQKISDLTKMAKRDTTRIDSTEMLSAKEEYAQNVIGINDDRSRLIKHIETMIGVYPKNRYNSNILFRLAELYYDKAGEDFQGKLKEYESKIATGTDTAGLEFPEYDLDKVILIYDDIIQNFPFDELADDACFYKSLALQKLGLNEEANDALIELAEKYPESEFYAEANMNIGRYYFEHPKIENNQGYRLAEEAFRKVLFFRDHPQYVQALYHLGWCYYMQDRYEEAIAAFKYLIEENKLDFDPSKMDEKQVVNPLLRGEAIDYIAISFDEEGKIDEAVKFLHLIGNDDYAAMVLKRIAELREEDLDYGAAVSVYKRLLEEYGLSTIAPEATMNLIKLYEGRTMPDSAMFHREMFFKLYSKGSIWQETIKNDSAMVQYIDSLSIMMGIFAGDACYRSAEEKFGTEAYKIAAEKYKKVVEKYPENINAAEARWNLAAIMELKLNDKPAAYSHYMSFSKLIGFDAARREQAAMNAIAIAQSILPVDSIVKSGDVDFAAKKVIEAVENYNELFPSGNAAHKVLMSMAAIYFNRQMFSKAAKIYKQVLLNSANNKEVHLEAQLLFGQCKFGEEIWTEASDAFEKVWNESNDQIQRSSAYKLLLQSEFHSARNILSKGDYGKAATAFRSIEDRFPGSEYGDIVLFNASEAYEKMGKQLLAADNYIDLVKRYPNSKYAPDALFNAALNYEKIDKFNKAAEAYDLIVNKYPDSEKAKDALFNLGFCYEKLGKMDKMAETNERYSLMYPGEKDVEVMLLRSADYYARAGMYDKASIVYKNFIRRYPNTPKAVEALYMIAKCSYDQNDIENALFGFNNTEQKNNNLIIDGFEPNNYFAAEAVYHSGLIKRDRFLKVKLALPEENMKQNLKEKSDLLNDAVKSFQRVIQYQSERMFEAAYLIGELYENFANAIRDQERQKLDPIKAAVSEKEIQTLTFQIMQNTFTPYAKVLEIGNSLDSVKDNQKIWISKARAGLEKNIIEAGTYLVAAVQSMQNAPIPKEIKEKILHNFQYQKKVLETLEPLKNQICQYYKYSINRIDSLKLSDSVMNVCKNNYARAMYLKCSDFDNLSKEILSSTKDLPGNLTVDEKEELVFQLEDIIFELQDKSILLFENALLELNNSGINSGKWHKDIVESLARLNPDKYGSSFYSSASFGTGDNWFVRADSVSEWNSSKIPADGWSYAMKTKNKKTDFKRAANIWGNPQWSTIYVWKDAFLSGTPRDGSIYIRSSGKYKLYVNSTLLLSDTVGSGNESKIDSASNITSILKGGDNIIAAEVFSNNQVQGVTIELKALVDTTQKFQTSLVIPKKISRLESGENSRSSSEADSENAKATEVSKIPSSQTESIVYRNSKEVANAIAVYKNKESLMKNEINKEQLEILRLKIEIEKVNKILKEKKDVKLFLNKPKSK